MAVRNRAKRDVSYDRLIVNMISVIKHYGIFIVTTNGNLLSVNNPIRWRTISFSMPGAIWSLS
jgi:hypothetical protein